MRGFPAGTRYTPVPDPILGAFLEQADDLAELKCTLLLLWLLQRKKGTPRFVAEDELLSDRTLNRGLGHAEDPRAEIRQGLRKAAEQGIILALELEVEGKPRKLYFLNDEEGRNAIGELQRGHASLEGLVPEEEEPPPPERPNIFVLYEENIGLITPIQAERLKEAEELYPWSWIEEAFEQAVARNARNWRYIESILERWAREGRGEHGKPGRYPEKISLKEYRRRYGRPARS